MKIINSFRNGLSRRRGQNTVEYLLSLAVVVGVVLVIGVSFKGYMPSLTGKITTRIGCAVDSLTGSTGHCTGADPDSAGGSQQQASKGGGGGSGQASGGIFGKGGGGSGGSGYAGGSSSGGGQASGGASAVAGGSGGGAAGNSSWSWGSKNASGGGSGSGGSSAQSGSGGASASYSAGSGGSSSGGYSAGSGGTSGSYSAGSGGGSGASAVSVPGGRTGGGSAASAGTNSMSGGSAGVSARGYGGSGHDNSLAGNTGASGALAASSGGGAVATADSAAAAAGTGAGGSSGLASGAGGAGSLTADQRGAAGSGGAGGTASGGASGGSTSMKKNSGGSAGLPASNAAAAAGLGKDYATNPAFENPENMKLEYLDVPGELFVAGDGEAAGADPTDVNQGALGDCYYLSSLAAIARQNPDFMTQAIRRNENGSYSADFYRKKSWWQFWKPEFSKVTVTVDGKFPVTRTETQGHPYLGSDGKLHAGEKVTVTNTAFAGYGDNSGGKNELWVMAMEKSYAEFRGSYTDIGEGGISAYAMEELTGKKSTIYTASEVTLAQIAEWDKKGYAITMGTLKEPPDKDVVGSHAYYLKSVDTEKGTITLGNPWGFNHVTLTEEEFQKNYRHVDINPIK